MTEESKFEYGAPAELFLTRSRSRKAVVQYRRFASAALAIQFFIDNDGMKELQGSVLEVDEQRFDSREIAELYAAAAYPLPRGD